MLEGFLILIGCQLLGEIIVEVFDMTVPGPVVGMLLLFFGLLVRKNVPDSLEKAGGGLLKHIGLLFVPAGAGISMYLNMIVEEWDVILVASVGSTVVTLLTCAFVFTFINQKKGVCVEDPENAS
ncbi:MAG: CidA/LrgA family protein [Alphaproteobacteria bacterium]